MKTEKFENIVRLRKASGQPIMDCKNALIETNSFDEAFDLLRKNATEKIDERRKNKIITEGRVIIKGTNEFPIFGSKIVMASLLCETDFTAKSEIFINALDKIAQLFLSDDELSNDSIMMIGVKDIIDETKACTGEKVELGQIYVFNIPENTSIGTYVHFDNKKAAMVIFEANSNPRELQILSKNIAMHVVASKPQYLDETEFKKGHHEDIKFPESAKGKPIEIQNKIRIGLMRKKMKDRVLLCQSYCLDDKISIDQAIKNVRREVMMEITLKKFKHIEIG